MFVAAYFERLRENVEVFDDDEQVAVYERKRSRVGGDLGFVLGRHGELRLGLVSGLGEAEVAVGASELPEFDADLGAFRVRLGLDRLDSPNIPTKGYWTSLDFTASQTWLGADDEYERLSLRTTHFWSRGRQVWNLAFLGGSSLGSPTPAYDQFTLGGLFSLNGLQENQLRGRYAGRISGRMLYRLGQLPNLVGRGVYAGGMVDTGQAWQRGSEIFEDLVWSGSALFAVDTFMGPFFLVYAIASTGQDQFYVTLGKNF
jgi:NTE family protein